jgi:hypothetical protein
MRDLHLHQHRGVIVRVRHDELYQLIVGILESKRCDSACLIVPVYRVPGVPESRDDRIDSAPHVPRSADEEVQILSLTGDTGSVVDQLLVNVKCVAARERDPVPAPRGSECPLGDIKLPGGDSHLAT